MEEEDEFSHDKWAEKYGWTYSRMFESGAKWTIVLFGLAIIPTIGTEALIYVLQCIEKNSKPVFELSIDSPFLILSYWGGILGALTALVYDQISTRTPVRHISVIVGKLYLGGMVGSLSFFSIRSKIIVSIFYPNLDLNYKPLGELVSYNAVFSVAILSGLLAPSVVKGMRRHSVQI